MKQLQSNYLYQTFLLLGLMLVNIPNAAGQFDYRFKENTVVNIPFEYHNNLIIVDVKFQGFLGLKFIFDTGAENTILSKKEIAEKLEIPYRREFNLIGADMSSKIKAYLISGVHLQISNMLLSHRTMLVLDEDVLRLEELTGMRIDGILGADIFKRYVVRVDYKRKIISLTRNEKRKFSDKYMALPTTIYRSKPYIQKNIVLQQGDTTNVKLLVDTGAALPLLLHSDTHPDITIPENAVSGTLGIGLGGFVEGYVGRTEQMFFGKNVALTDILTNFQKLSPDLDTTFLNSRNGIMGNQLLNRFELIINYPKEQVYLRPTKKWKKSFEYDKSGLTFIAGGANLNKYIVHQVMPNTPAAEAGLQKGDVVKKVNFLSAEIYGLTGLTKKVRKKAGKKIRMVVLRGEERLVFRFRLRKIV